eukprot:3656915-Pleurochrysis_carterae.AAC.4
MEENSGQGWRRAAGSMNGSREHPSLQETSYGDKKERRRNVEWPYGFEEGAVFEGRVAVKEEARERKAQ